MYASVMVGMHRLGDISPGLRASSRWHQPKAGNIIQGMHRSSVECAHQLRDIGRWLNASARQFRRMVGSLNKGFHASDIVWVFLASDIRQQHETSSKACTKNSWHMCIILPPSTPINNMHHKTRLVHFGKATLVIDMQHHTRHTHILHGKCASIKWSVQWNAAKSKAFTHRSWCLFFG